MACRAYTDKGIKCNHNAKEGDLCGIHAKCRTHAGPNQFEVDQLANKYKYDQNIMQSRIDADYAAAGDNPERILAMRADFNQAMRELSTRYRVERRDLIERQDLEVQRTGVDPDAEVKARKRRQADEREQRREQAALDMQQRAAEINARREGRIAGLQERMREANERWRLANENLRVLRERAAQLADNRLRNIANDSQNVHTSEMVKQTKDIIAKVRQIPVPDAYKWNPDIMTPTVGEIMSECKLSHRAAAQMFNQYSARTAIYDIEEGIYGKVLDSVWQFVKNSPDKADLCRIIKTEMEDNVGMCAQGNLTRVCNVLAGYVDGIAPPESLSEKLGRLMPALMEIEDIETRREAAEKIMTENAVPRDRWAEWIDAVM